MAEYGIEIRDADGNVIFDNERLTQRLWYWGIHANDSNVTYPTPLNHEPTVVILGIGNVGAFMLNHRVENGQYIGCRLGTPRRPNSGNLVLVFMREW